MAAINLTTYLWFDNQALEAATFYVGLLPESRLGEISYYQADAQQPEGSVLTVEFEIFGRPFAALNGGPQFPHSEAVSSRSRATPRTTSTGSGTRSPPTAAAKVNAAGARTAGE